MPPSNTSYISELPWTYPRLISTSKALNLYILQYTIPTLYWLQGSSSPTLDRYIPTGSRAQHLPLGSRGTRGLGLHGTLEATGGKNPPREKLAC